MAIFREPLATKNFTQVPNHWLRDPRLTAKAKGILAYIASHAAGYELTVAQIIAEMKDGESAVKAAMRELEAAGYLRRRQRRDDSGRLSGTDYWIVEDPEADPTVGRFSASGKSASGETASGSSASGESGTKNNNPKNTTTKNTTGAGQGSTTAGRSAPSGGGKREPDGGGINDVPSGPSDAERLTRKRLADRDLFLELVEAEHIRSDGTRFTEGLYRADQFYEAFRRMKYPKPIGFPGAYIQPMHNASPGSGVRDWLLTLGLEPA
ncbi:hypothetical protein ABZY58_11230 [Micromonospora tulbaghiae]|uniref:hypothetical protein n=1 Tax=Micromonospora tulbaghiae TaxID=479978 RepID=UPI0033A41C23